MNELTFPLPLFRQSLRELVRNRRRPQRYPLGICQRQGHSEFLVRPRGSEGRRWLIVSAADNWPAEEAGEGSDADVLLYLGRRRGELHGFVVQGSETKRLDRLNLVGPGMHTLNFPHEETENRNQGGDNPTESIPERWSRTIGALGGRDVWERVKQLSVGIIGVGRTGSFLSEALARFGLSLRLIDPDLIELHNLGEMALIGESEMGLPKVQAVANALVGRTPGMSPPVAIVESVTRRGALRALQECDFLFGSVDNDAARLAVAMAATLFHKPLIDVGSGIHGASGGRQMGVDVRLVTPSGRCLLCLGGLQTAEQARQTLASAAAEQISTQDRDWTQERAGSLASLNQFASACVLRLFEDFMAERITESTWLHAEYDPAGRLAVSYPPARRPAAICAMCRLSGAGEEALPQLPEFLRTVVSPYSRETATGGTTPHAMPAWLL